MFDGHAYQSLITAGTAPATARAHKRDIRYFRAWARLALGVDKSEPVIKESVIAFILQHCGTMPFAVEDKLVSQGLRKKRGPLAMRSIQRILGSLSAVLDLKGLPNPIRDPQVRILLKKARHARAGEIPHQKAAITQDILRAMLASCDDSLRGIRDRAILLLGFSTGGRRRSELAALQVSDLMKIPEGFLLTIQKSKNDQAGKGTAVPLIGPAADAVVHWLQYSQIKDGSLFRGIHRSGRLYQNISGETIHRLVKRRIQMAGFNPKEYGTHSLRSGFLTEAARNQIPLPDAMQLSGHRSPTVAHGYYRQVSILENPAARLIEPTNNQNIIGLRGEVLPC